MNFDSTLPLLLAAIAGFFAAAINAVAGGGTLISFPTLIALGLDPRVANATNAVALWPGSATGALGFHKYFHETKSQIKLLLPPTILGSILGSILLVQTSAHTFKTIVPILLLSATLLLAFQKKIRAVADKKEFRFKSWQVIILQFLVSVYGGYFGAGMGIMMLAVLSLFESLDIHRLNAVKNWLAVIINFGASIILLKNGLVDLKFGLAVMTGALFGGYASAFVGQKIDPDKLRIAIVIYGMTMVGFMIWELVSAR